MSIIENITLGQIAAVVIFISGLYLGIKTLKKELKEAITGMLEEEFDAVNKRIDDDDDRIGDLEDQMKFMYKALSLLLQDDLAILEHLRTNNNTGNMAKQEDEVHKFLTKANFNQGD